jgi:hypothetical protein
LAATGETRALVEGAILSAGDEVRTAIGGNAALEFADGSRLKVRADSQLLLDTISAYGRTGMVDTRVRLRRGRLDSLVNPGAGPGSRYEIRTPAALSAVRGTELRVRADEARGLYATEVLRGRVAVSGAGKTRIVAQGFGITVRPGERPAPPRRLLPAPDLGTLDAVVDRVPLQFSWPALDGAVAYRVQLANTIRFQKLLSDGTTGTPVWRGPEVPDGELVLRVRGIDGDGLEGLNSDHPFTVDAWPEPPLLIAPAAGSTVRVATPSFEWSEPLQASGYHFQLATSADFIAPVTDIADQSKSPFTYEQALTPGLYYWRVATLGPTEEHGPFSDAQEFRLRPAPQGPQPGAPAIEENHLEFSWRAGEPGQSYELQLASDAGFQEAVFSAVVAEPRIRVPRPLPGLYYVRSRTIDVDGYVGSFGSVQRMHVPADPLWPAVIMGTLLGLMLLL